MATSLYSFVMVLVGDDEVLDVRAARPTSPDLRKKPRSARENQETASPNMRDVGDPCPTSPFRGRRLGVPTVAAAGGRFDEQPVHGLEGILRISILLKVFLWQRGSDLRRRQPGTQVSWERHPS